VEDRLYRSSDDRVLAGVAGGIAEHWDADPSLVRIVWVLAAIFTGGLALIVYIVMAIVVPERPFAMPGAPVAAAPVAGAPVDPATGRPMTRAEIRAARRAARRARRGSGDGRVVVTIVGLFLVLLGVWFLFREYLPRIDFGWFWPMIVIGLGAVLILSAVGRRDEAPPASGPWMPPDAPPPAPSPVASPPVAGPDAPPPPPAAEAPPAGPQDPTAG